MNKLTYLLLVALFLVSMTSTQAGAKSLSSFAAFNTTTSIAPGDHTAGLDRLTEISLIDKSNLSFAEKRQLRKESRAIKQHAGISNGGIYLSAGAVILIVVLIVILL